MASTQNSTSIFVPPNPQNREKLFQYLTGVAVHNPGLLDNFSILRTKAADLKVQRRVWKIQGKPVLRTAKQRRAYAKREPIPKGVHPGELSPDYLHRMDYGEYLQTDHWSDMRAKKLAQARNRCQVCNTAKTLEVHHRTYERRGYEDLEDLTVLCRPCHKLFHGTSDEQMGVRREATATPTWGRRFTRA